MAGQAQLAIIITGRDDATKVLGTVEKRAGALTKSLGDMTKIAGGFLGAQGVLAVGRQLNDVFAKANEQIRVEKQLDTVLESTGHAAGLSADQIKKMASALQRQTTYGDEAILDAQNLLLTFTSIGKDVFPEATETVLNMSTALGQDLKSSSIQLGKALQDPINGATALKRVGVNLSDAQMEQIKSFMAVNDQASAQRLILDELSKEFGGSARAQAETYAGRMKQMSNAIGDLKEKIGIALLPVVVKLGDWFAAHQPAIEAFVDRGINAVRDAVIRARPVIETFQHGLQVIGEAVKKVTQYLADHKPALLAVAVALGIVLVALNPIPAAILAVILAVGYLSDHWDQIKAKTLEVWNAISAFLDEKLPYLKEVIVGTFNVIRTDVETAITLVRDVINIVMALLHGDWSAAWDGLKTLVGDTLEGIRTAIVERMELLGNTMRFLGTAMLNAFTGAFGAIGGAVWGIMQDLGSSLASVINAYVIPPLNGLIKAYNMIPLLPDVGEIPPISFGPSYTPSSYPISGGTYNPQYPVGGGGGGGGGGAQAPQTFYIDKVILQGDAREALAALGASL